MDQLKNNSRDTQFLLSLFSFVGVIFFVFLGCFYTRLKHTGSYSQFPFLLEVPFGLIVCSVFPIIRIILARINRSKNKLGLVVTQIFISVLVSVVFCLFSKILLNIEIFAIISMAFESLFIVHYVYSIFKYFKERNS